MRTLCLWICYFICFERHSGNNSLHSGDMSNERYGWQCHCLKSALIMCEKTLWWRGAGNYWRPVRRATVLFEQLTGSSPLIDR